MVFASTTAIDMVSANLEMNSNGRAHGQLSRLPSDFNIVRANYFDVNPSRDNDATEFEEWDRVQRYSLSDNPRGNLNLQHYQQYSSAIDLLSRGAGSPAYALSQVGGALLDAGTLQTAATALIIDASFLSWNRLNASNVYKAGRRIWCILFSSDLLDEWRWTSRVLRSKTLEVGRQSAIWHPISLLLSP